MIRVIRETHDTPPAIAERLARAGGWNRFGEPNFRVVWGWSRLSWIGGRWTDRDAHGNIIRSTIELRRVPKYLPFDRWHIERWVSPEIYGSPNVWHAATLEREDGMFVSVLGPYPSRGEYEQCFTLSGRAGEFIPLDSSACDKVVRAIEWARRQPRGNSRRALDTRESQRERDADARIDEVLDDDAPAFHSQPFVSLGGR
ncbi:MAG: hypothetical protein WAK91_10440 [Candidatus Acidiferrales bacterium]|jgi:hypothetical protein